MSNVTTALATLPQRVRYAQKQKLISTRDLADSVRQDPEKLAAWLESTDLSGTVFLAQLADILSVNLSWLVTGLGHAERLEEDLDSSDVELLSVVRNLSPMSRAALLNTAERMLDTEQTFLAQERSSQHS